MARSVTRRVAFKLVRMPMSWRVRRFINGAIARARDPLGWPPRAPELDTLLHDGQLLTNAAALGIDTADLLVDVEACALFDQWLEHQGEFDLASVPEKVNVAEVAMSETVRRRVDEIGEQLLALPIIQGYFQGRPSVSDSSIWWSFGGREEREAQLWHRDIDNIYFLKLFVYLTDVDDRCGPHEYAVGSHRWNEYLSFARLSPAEMSTVFPTSKLMRCTGPAGTVILEDTFGFHRGTSPAPGERRCILQYQFSMLPNP